jgi:hypothetical protein
MENLINDFEVEDLFGETDYTGNKGSFFETWTLKDNEEFVCQIMPAIKKYTGDQYAVFNREHFGYRGINPRDPTKTFLRTFECVEKKDRRTEMVTQACAECDDTAPKRKALEAEKLKLEAEGKSKEQIADLLQQQNDYVRAHNRDSKWRMIVKRADGKIGVLKIAHTCKLELNKCIEALRKEDGIDKPLSPKESVWLSFTRSGKNFSVKPVYTSQRVEGKIIKTIKMEPLTAQDVETLKKAPDLTKAVRKLTSAQISSLVHGTHDPEEVDSIFDAAAEASASPVAQKTAPAPKPVAAAPKPAPAPTPAPAPAAEDDLDAQIARLQAAKAAREQAQAKPATPAAKAAAASPAPAPAGDVDFGALSDEELASMLSPKK